MQTDSQVRAGSGNKDKSLALNGGKPQRDSWLPYGHQVISEKDVAAVVATLKSDWLTQGPAIKAFEEVVAAYTGCKFAVAYSSGTAALHGAYYAAGVGEKDEIVTSPITFAATSNAAVYLGARPVFADVSPTSGLIDLESAKKRVSNRTRAIVGIDYSGQPCDYDGLAALAAENHIPFIIDAAHSLGAQYKGKSACAQGDMAILSFHPVKSITTGEGGMVLTNNAEYYEKLLIFRTHGIEKRADKFELANDGPWYHEMQTLGFNYRMCDLQAALGTSQMTEIDGFIKRRREIAAAYRRKLANSAHYDCLEVLEGRDSSYHLFPILVKAEAFKMASSAEARKFAFEALHAENIGVQVHYIPTYKFPFYKKLLGRDWAPDCPNAEEFYAREIGLPIFASMTEKDIDDVVAALEKIAASV